MNKKFTRLITLVLVFLFSSSAFFVQGQATLTTDKPDYAPLSNAVFTGAGFAPNENVTLRVKNLTQPCNTTSADSSYASWTVTANASGSFVTNWTVCNCPGDSLRLKGVGQTSGLIAYVLFSDAGTSLSNPTPTSATYGSIISISTKLTQQGSGSAPVFVGNGNPIPGKNVTFTLNRTALGASVATDGQGVATLNTTISLPANTYTGNEALTVDFAGDATPYAATSKKVNFTVTKATSIFSQVSGSGIYGLPANLTATVNLNVAGLPINFTLDGVAVGNSVTNSNGVANLTVAFESIPASVKNAGIYSGKLGVSINNTDNYSAASGTGNITIAKAAQTIRY